MHLARLNLLKQIERELQEWKDCPDYRYGGQLSSQAKVVFNIANFESHDDQGQKEETINAVKHE